MRVEPRFRGLMARTVLLVYTLFELLGSEVPIVSASAAPCASFAAVVVQNGSQKESVDAFSCLTVETDDVVVVAFAVVCEVFEEFIDSVVVWFLCIWSCHIGLFSVLNPLKQVQGRTWV